MRRALAALRERPIENAPALVHHLPHAIGGTVSRHRHHGVMRTIRVAEVILRAGVDIILIPVPIVKGGSCNS